MDRTYEYTYIDKRTGAQRTHKKKYTPKYPYRRECRELVNLVKSVAQNEDYPDFVEQIKAIVSDFS